MLTRTLSVLFLTANLSLVLGQSKQIFEFTGQDTKSVSVHKMNENIKYENQGFGIDLNTDKNVQIVKHSRNSSLYSNKPFYFSADVEEGNYKVTIHYRGLKDKTIFSTVRAESRRWLVDRVEIPKNKKVQKSFIVHIKDRKIDENNVVRLKTPREIEKLDWDNKLTLEFQGENNIESITIESIEKVTTLFLAGNSTVVNQEHEPWASWGQMIPRYFDQGIAVANHAESGLALSSFLSSNRLDKILAVAKPGDYLFIEFGHNDQKEKGDKSGAYNGYTERLRLFVNKFRAIGGYPLIVTSTERRSFDKDGNLNFTLGEYPAAARKVAEEMNVPLIDLNTMTREFYQALGVENSKNALVHYPANTFPDQSQALADNTHFNTYGAGQIAKMILKGIIDLDLPIRKNIINYKKYSPKTPDDFTAWDWPLSVLSSELKPDGN
ncbi:rhamnogalacturonan acetylesterase [Sphingobacterium bovistauri]|uniref:Rhamnogalacturonan acetylesterase n=1 Tax=Sphingobacterium bovistauri TaxID=2781959 RepID=A0ABS7Z4E2_9SPHI|nr:rhamnogalacturonan acetylesterase [Sphingobacterium bovistauri]MCA5003834.1 rhamnogalacturonan acetylesterase [Sphingobacterium bovistauri]